MKKIIKAVIVDDEPLARKLLKEYLQDYPNITVAAECKNGRQAVKAINENKPDLVFLDIRMPGMDGFEVLENLKRIPDIIFTTAYGDYALKAFEMNAVDYLLKPYNRKRFARAIEKAIDRKENGNDKLDNVLRALQQSRESDIRPEHIFVRIGKKIVSVQVSNITCIKADGDYSQLHTNNGIYLCSLTMNTLEQKLDPSRFLRIHRSYIIAIDSVEHLKGDGEGGFIAVLKDKSRVRVSRTYMAKFREIIW